MSKQKRKEKTTGKAARSQGQKNLSGKRTTFILISIAVTFAAFIPSLQNGFVNLDDPQYVTANPVIQKMSSENIRAVFQHQFVGNYQPLSMLSYMVDYQLFNLRPFGYHFVNLLLHLLSTFLVFLVIEKLSGKILVAFGTSVLFGIHPLHVESVAWIAERKDVLYGAFFLSSLYFYVLHTKLQQSFSRYFLLSLLLFICAVLSKAQAVVLPVALLLVDYLAGRKYSFRLFSEKILFFVLAVVFGWLAYQKQKEAGATQDYSYFSAAARILFPCYALVNYFRLIIFPFNLSCFYPYPETDAQINTGWVYAAPVFLLAITLVAWKYLRQSREFLFGIFFFLATILLVLQVIPLGDALYADRYTYIPSIGLFFAASWFFEKFYSERRNIKSSLQIGGAVALAALAITTLIRCGVWKDSITLYSDAIDKYPDVPILHNNRGAELYGAKRYEEALKDFERTVELKPRYPNGLTNLAVALEHFNRNEEALQKWNQAGSYFPKELKVFTGRANLLSSMGRYAEAANDFSKAIALKPNDPNLCFSRAQAYGFIKKFKEAIDDLNIYIPSDPSNPDGYNIRGAMYAQSGNPDLAIADFSKAIALRPDFANAYNNRSYAYEAKKDYAAALSDVLKAKEMHFAVDENRIAQLSGKH